MADRAGVKVLRHSLHRRVFAMTERRQDRAEGRLLGEQCPVGQYPAARCRAPVGAVGQLNAIGWVKSKAPLKA